MVVRLSFLAPVIEWHLSRVRQAQALLQPENGMMDECYVLYIVQLHILCALLSI